MINKIRKYQDSWITKGILFLTALSFMSLFGISSYIGSAGKNKPVIKVDSLELLQNEIMVQYNKQLEMAKGILGDQVTDNVKAAILQQIVTRNLSDMVILRTADKYNMSVSDNQVRDTVYSRAEFANDYGQFDINKMRRTLLMYGLNESDYINQLKRDIEKQHLIYIPAENINVPEILAKYYSKSQNVKKKFKYIKIDADKANIERKISQEEIEQYYDDFIVDFTIPEARDIKFIHISNEEIAGKIIPQDSEINEYYNEHITQFETPEQRRVLQMVFGNEEQATEAINELSKNKDFFAVAEQFANQSREDTDFGFVSKDLLLEEISTAAFSGAKNKIIGPIQSDLGWHILKITEIKPMVKTEYAKAKSAITEEIRKERVYDMIQKIIREIDDNVVSGLSIEDIAKGMDLKLYTAKGITENGSINKIQPKFKDLGKNIEFIDAVFSYNIGEISQTLETDDGIILATVTNIVEAHPKNIEEVRPEIEKMWAENERSAIVREIVTNVLDDLDQGETIEDIASRFKLTQKATKPLSKTETFEDFNDNIMAQLFQEKYNTPKVINQGNVSYIIISEKVPNSKNEVEQKDINMAKASLKMSLFGEYSAYLIDSFAKDYKIKIDYSSIGLGEEE